MADGPIVLTITLDPKTGAVHVNGPLANKLLCYGMLEEAKDVCRDFHKHEPPAEKPGPKLFTLDGRGSQGVY